MGFAMHVVTTGAVKPKIVPAHIYVTICIFNIFNNPCGLCCWRLAGKDTRTASNKNNSTSEKFSTARRPAPGSPPQQLRGCVAPSYIDAMPMKVNSPLPQALPKECAKAAAICASFVVGHDSILTFGVSEVVR